MIGFWKKIKSDIKKYNFENKEEQKVVEAHFFSAYKRTFVIKMPIGPYGASFGILFIGTKVRSTEMVKHEYGHKVQLKRMGLWRYIFHVAIPSMTANILERMGKLPYDYYGSVWEQEADRLGGVHRERAHRPWPEGACDSYRDLIRLFLKKG